MRGHYPTSSSIYETIDIYQIVETWTYDELDEYFTYDVINTVTNTVVGTFEDSALAVAHAKELVEMVDNSLLGDE